jgi:ATP-dependent Lhr-like helicase
VRRLERSDERVTMSATDPLNLVGVVLPGPRVPAQPTNSVTFVDGSTVATEDHTTEAGAGHF